MWSNSELVNFIYLKVLFSEPKNKLSILSSISLITKKNFGKKIRQQICINCVGVLINNPPSIEFSYKFEFILCKTWEINSFAALN